MFSHRASIPSILDSFQVKDRMLCYSSFVPRLYNWCVSLGFTPGKIMPSRAFCSDESQGFPIILLAKHFGAFPFNHGRVGGIVSVDRHGPHADHGKDLVLIQASHVGYDPETGRFGLYRRLHTDDLCKTGACGKIGHILDRYREEYDYARVNVRLMRHAGRPALFIDNWLLSRAREEGLFLIFEHLLEGASGRTLPPALAARSTGYVFSAAQSLVARLGEAAFPATGSVAIGERLAAGDFYFHRDETRFHPVQDRLEINLLPAMPWILTSRHPMLTAACANTAAEFDRTYRSLAQTAAMRGKNLLFIAGVNIDISPNVGEDFPATRFIPWAAYLQRANGEREILEQPEVYARLEAVPPENPGQLNLERAIQGMGNSAAVEIKI